MIDDKYLKNNYIYFADVGAMGGVQPKWKDITNCYFSVLFEPNKSSYEELIVNKKENEIIHYYISIKNLLKFYEVYIK